MRVGPRTATEYRQEKGGGLDAFYAMNPPDADAKAAAQNNFENYGNLGPMGPAKLEQAQTFATAQGWGFDPATGYKADGGTLDMPVGKPTLVGEEGPELILPRDDGRGFVVPADITQQILPAMPGLVPRREGGELPVDQVVRSAGGSQAAMMGPSGAGFAQQLPRGTMPLAAQTNAPMMFDPATGYQMDMSQPGMPIMPDVVEGPWAQPGLPMLPEQRQALTDETAGKAQRLMMRDGVMTDQERFDRTTVTDGVTGDQLSLGDMRGRVIDRSSMAFQASEDARVQRDLAARAARAPVGAAAQPTGIRPQVQERMDRNMEKFMRTPQGAMFAMQQGQEAAMMNQKAQQQQQQQQLATQWQMMNDPNTGKPVAMVNGRGQTVNLPKMEKAEQVIYIDVQKPDPSGFGIITMKEPRILNTDTNTMREIPTETGQESPATGGDADGAPEQTGLPVTVRTVDEARKLPPGTRFRTPDGKIKIR